VIGAFLWHEGRAAEPILPLQLLRNRTRSSANAARGLLYAGFYGLFYFMGLFIQEVQNYSPLRTGLAFLPMPVSVFLSSQFTTRVLMRRLPEKVVMVLGTAIGTAGLLSATGIGASSSYFRIVASLVLIGAGSGATLVALTSASLADVEPEVAGAASGLVNVSQQIGAAVGLAVLVTVFNAFDGSARLGPGAAGATAHVVHSIDGVFGVASLFALASFLTVVTGIRRTRTPSAAVVESVDERAVAPEALECGGASVAGGEESFEAPVFELEYADA
jgi:predicted MFS family arabinose efflux permease